VAVETEIKLRIAEHGTTSIRGLLDQHGFAETAPRVLEVDQVYDLPNQELRSSARLLRLRHSGDTWTLTYKGPPEPGPHKSREEIETTLADGAAFELILTRLGYVPAFRYEKFRTTFRAAAAGVGDGLVTLDETPIGVFIELEGPGYWIDRTATLLGFGAEEYITRSYAALYLEHLNANPGEPPNMTFVRPAEPPLILPRENNPSTY
jgi:adenylate cyclase class 2